MTLLIIGLILGIVGIVGGIVQRNITSMLWALNYSIAQLTLLIAYIT